MSPARSVILILSLGAILSLNGCHSIRRVQPNIFVFLIDALRADRLDQEIGGKPLAPFLHSLRAQSINFERAYAAAPWTMPSLASLWTARYPSQHQVQSFHAVLPASEVTLAEQLKQAGYRTGAFDSNILVNPAAGFAQGFDFYGVWAPATAEETKRIGKTRAPLLHQKLGAWLDKNATVTQTAAASESNPTPLFVYMHYLETHVPFTPPRERVERILDARPNAAEKRAALDGIGWNLLAVPRDQTGIWQSLLEDLYDAEVATIDADLEGLFKELQRRHLLDNAIVVVTSDHGEGWGENAFYGHGRALYEPVIRVPLFFWGTDLAPQSVQTRVSLVDVAPTLLELANASALPEARGRSLTALFRADRYAGWRAQVKRWFGANPTQMWSPIYAELGRDPKGPLGPNLHTCAWIDGDSKIIETSAHGILAFDLSIDPEEKQPLPVTAESVQRQIQAMQRFSDSLSTPIGPDTTRTIDPKVREQMRALDYGDSD